MVKQLRDEDAGFATIRRKIGHDTVGHGDSPSTHGGATVVDDEPTAEAPSGHGAGTAAAFDTSALIAQVVDAIGGQTELAEKYARAAHTIGQLEERVANMSSQLAEARGLLIAGESERQAERDRLVGELAAARALLAVPKPMARPWWKVWG